MMSDDPEKTAFKDWFDASAAKALAKQIKAVKPDFESKKFINAACRDLDSLEMMARVAQFAEALRDRLPEEIPDALDVLVASLPEAMQDCEAITEGWLQWPIGYFIGTYCVDYYAESLHAMIEFTQRFSAEFAIRPFADRYPEQVFDDLLHLAQTHHSPHVRRWASEGIRPRLPWGRKLRGLIGDPSPLWPILESLKDDPELYVRRSVANNLNDIAKDHPEAVVARCKKWAKGASAERLWVIKHGLRSLIKNGHPGALAIIGFPPPKHIELALKVSPKTIEVGEPVKIELRVSNHHERTQNLIIDYAVGFVRQGGKMGRKVFKGTTLKLGARESAKWNKAHPMKITTVRRLYSGIHTLEVQVNGQTLARGEFTLKL
ncbi:MAG: DNA alkylation repair protein [Opitutales bacterium]